MRPIMSSLILAAILGSAIEPLRSAETMVAATHEEPRERAEAMRIRILVKDQVVTARLYDNETSRDFLFLLPIDLVLDDYAAKEKINYLPRRLSTEGAPEGADPSVGDIGYYAPWGNLVIYYEDFGYSSGLVKLGEVESGLEILRRPGSLDVTIERLDEDG